MRGRPVLGVLSGLLFGLCGAVLLQQLGVYPLTTVMLLGLPVIGVLFGLLMAAWAPLNRGG